MGYTYFETIPSELITIIFSYLKHDNISKFHTIIKHFYSVENLFIYRYPLLYKDIIKVIPDDIRLNSNNDKWIELYSHIWYDNYNTKGTNFGDFGSTQSNQINSKMFHFSKLTIEEYVKYYDSNIIYRAYVSKHYNDLYKKIIKYESFDKNCDIEYYIYEKSLYNFPWNDFCNLLITIDGDTAHWRYLNRFYDLIENQINIKELLDIIISDTKLKEFIIKYTDHEYMKRFSINYEFEDLFKCVFQLYSTRNPQFIFNVLEEICKNNRFELFKWSILKCKEILSIKGDNVLYEYINKTLYDRINDERYLKFLEENK